MSTVAKFCANHSFHFHYTILGLPTMEGLTPFKESVNINSVNHSFRFHYTIIGLPTMEGLTPVKESLNVNTG